jgi:hypothetical protein
MKQLRNKQNTKPLQSQVCRLFLLVIATGLLFASLSGAQQTDEQKGIDQDNYNIKQSIEFGFRFTSLTGDLQTYDTMVNLQQGPRLLNFTTEMRSLDHRGVFFDRLYFSNFGYGGDPNVVSVLRIGKNKWYAFDAMFRHDENFWDYSLLANPFNPATPVANAPANFNPLVNASSNVLGTTIVGISPHYYNTRRNMQNYNVTFLPDSKIRVRAGYNLNTNTGPDFSTIHQGTEQFLLQNFSATLSQYRLGVDFRFLPRTNISYDQTWSYYKTDPGVTDVNQQFSVGSGLPPVDLGVSWNPPSQPCNPTFQAGSIVNPKCSAYYDYFSHRQTRMNFPTEQISFQSNIIPALQMSGKFSYTGGDMNVNSYQQSFAGLESRSQLTNFLQNGPIEGRHVASYGDFGATWKISPMLSVVDSFDYSNWLEPGQFVSSECSFFSTNLIVPPNVFAPTASLPFAPCVAPPNGVAGTPNHTSSSGPDMLINLDSNFLKQRIYTNLIEAQVELSAKAGAYFGYRYRNREIADNFYNTQNAIYFPNNPARGSCASLDSTLPVTQPNLPDGCTLNPDGSISYLTPGATFGPPGVTNIETNSAVLGLWLRPTRNLSFNLDAELSASNNTFTRVSPLQSQQVRFRMKYKVKNWLNLSGNASTLNGQNNVDTVNGLQRNWNLGFSLALTPSEKFSAQLGYNYNSIFSQILICYTSSAALPGLPACPNLPGLLQQLAVYDSRVNTGFLDFIWTPLNRLTLEAGANLVGASGSELNLSPESAIPTAPTGSLNSNWYQPYGVASYRFAKHWTGRARWDYYGYHEDTNGSYQDLYAPRNFRGNLVTLSVRFAF